MPAIAKAAGPQQRTQVHEAALDCVGIEVSEDAELDSDGEFEIPDFLPDEGFGDDTPGTAGSRSAKRRIRRRFSGIIPLSRVGWGRPRACSGGM